MIPYGHQDIDEADVQAVVEVLRSDWLTQGPAVGQFEERVAAFCHAKYAVAVNSATSALHLACMVLEVGPGDVVWTSANTFVASANCARYCGANVDFIDIDPITYNISIVALKEKLEQASGKGVMPKVVIAVHFAGQPCDMREMRELSQKFGFFIIEDASQAAGATYHGEPIGAGVHSDLAVFSFHPVKSITTGEGGLVTTNDGQLYERLRQLRSHGITRDPARMAGKTHGPWYYEQLDLGFNYRMTDIQAALGSSQLRRIETFMQKRRSIVERYSRLLQGLPITRPQEIDDRRSSWHLYVIKIPPDAAKSRAEVFASMRAAGVGVNVHYIPVHLQPYYRDLGFSEGHCPEAERYYAAAISLPIFTTLTTQDQDYVAESLGKALA